MKVFVIFSIIVAVALAKPSGLGGYEFIDYNGYPAPFNYHAHPLLLTASKGWESFKPDLVLKEESKKPQTLDVKMEEFEDFSEKKKDGKPEIQTLDVSMKEKKDMSEKKEIKEIKEKKEVKEKKDELIFKKILVTPSYTGLPAYTSLPFGHTNQLVYTSLPVSTHSYVAPKVAYAPITSSYVPHAAPAPWASAPVAHATVQGHGPWASAPVAKYEVPPYSKFEYSIHEYKPPTYSYVTVKPKAVKVDAGWW